MPTIIFEDRARRLAAAILDGLSTANADGLSTPNEELGYRVTKRNACSGCPSSACTVCGVVLPGDVIIITHSVKGKRHLSDKAVHYLSHGLTHYETGYVYRGEPVTVDLDLNELEGYLQPL
jgi:hypothetical protein